VEKKKSGSVEGEKAKIPCPRCGCELDNYNRQEGGWCSHCNEWYPADIIEEHLYEED